MRVLVVEDDAEERESLGRARNGEPPERTTVRVEVLEGGGLSPIDIGVDRAKPPHETWGARPGHEEL